tara:strand:- start:507 stop:683 length:177 start_codon:yes stop_codon:yes gene_type:complete
MSDCGKPRKEVKMRKSNKGRNGGKSKEWRKNGGSRSNSGRIKKVLTRRTASAGSVVIA